MNRAETAEAIKVMQHYADGGAIERDYDGVWVEWVLDPDEGEGPIWDWDKADYRIKPVPKVVPWTYQTFPLDRPVWVHRKTDNGIAPLRALVVMTHGNYVRMFEYSNDERNGLMSDLIAFEDLAENYIQHDGSPCGTVEEG